VKDFRVQFGASPENPNHNRWYFWVDQYVVVCNALPHLLEFLRSREKAATVDEMIRILTGEATCKTFLLELTTITEMGKNLSAICYELEGDGPLIFKTYELVRQAQNHLAENARLPQRVIDLCMSLATNALGVRDQDSYFAFEAYCRSLITPARQYFAEQLTKDTVSSSLLVAKVAAMWNPLKARSMTLDDRMLAVPFHFLDSSPGSYLVLGIDAQKREGRASDPLDDRQDPS
jgi:hypothetical protein